MFYTVIKHDRYLRTLGKCRKHEPQASVFYISRVFSNDWSVLSQCNTLLKARLHRRFLSRQLDAIFVALGCNFKIARVNQVRFLVQFVAAISQGFRTCLKLVATLARQKLHRVAATKIACVNGPYLGFFICFMI